MAKTKTETAATEENRTCTVELAVRGPEGFIGRVGIAITESKARELAANVSDPKFGEKFGQLLRAAAE